MNDERVPIGPFLGREDFSHRDRVERVGAEAIDRLGRERHQTAAAQDLARARDVGRCGWNEVVHLLDWQPTHSDPVIVHTDDRTARDSVFNCLENGLQGLIDAINPW